MKYILLGILYAIFIGIVIVTYIIRITVLIIWNFSFKKLPSPKKHADELSDLLEDWTSSSDYDSGY